MTTEELQEKIRNIQHCGQGGTMSVIPVLKLMSDKIAELEARLDKFTNRPPKQFLNKHQKGLSAGQDD